MNDPVIEEVRTAREKHTEKFNYDLHAICEDLRRKERELGRTNVKPTAQEVFAKAVSVLPLSERLRLAALILQDLTQSEVSVVDRRDAWDERDECDLTAFSLQYAAQLYPEDEDLV